MNNKGRAAGRSGLGAVMGSKRLKAVAVRGKQKIPVFDEKRAAALRRENMKEMAGPFRIITDFGTCGLTIAALEHDDSPVKNWGGVSYVDFPNFRSMDAGPLIDRQSKKYACYRCPVGCGGHMTAGTSDYRYEAGAHKPEYETMAMFGSNCLNENLDAIIKANDICNRLGIDTISAGAGIAFAIECYENGLITRKDTGGIEMTWGNHKAIVAMTEKLGNREGFGDVLADGVKIAAEKIGRGAGQYAMHLHGQEVPAHDPKYGWKWAICYRMDATPARHTQGGGISPPGLPLPEFDTKAVSGKAAPYRILNGMNHIVNATGLCQIVYGNYVSVNMVVEFLKAITGWDVTLDELIKTGERIATLRHAFNLREGLNPLLYDIPGRVAGQPPKQSGPLAGVTLDETTLDRELCEEMDWDPVTTKPGKKKLLALGLAEVAAALWP
ncbi:MAG TPA: aldehyde ferredoxin oxidoreductase C-terminal domain-containing protein [Dehalococcoidales bacterium]|nr:aldehyde ferredoxin oxidoreductase C-terminal domain-containing protein [Dehalococcoidales bacterium]